MTLATIKKQRNNSLTMFQKIAKNDQNAVVDCIDQYGNLIWALARNLTDSTEDAEIAVREIFLDIWRYAAQYDSTDYDELIFITILARNRLINKVKKS
jgi:DNA-directed RNA polymerase specialized sigma24 family protein